MDQKQRKYINSMTVLQLMQLAQMEENDACDCEMCCNCRPPHLLCEDGQTELYPWMAKETLRDIGAALKKHGYVK